MSSGSTVALAAGWSPGPRGVRVAVATTVFTASPALRTALAYYHAWTSHDLDKAISYIADGVVCDAPAGRLEGAAAPDP